MISWFIHIHQRFTDTQATTENFLTEKSSHPSPELEIETGIPCFSSCAYDHKTNDILIYPTPEPTALSHLIYTPITHISGLPSVRNITTC